MAEHMTDIASLLPRTGCTDDGMIASSLDLFDHLARVVDTLQGSVRTSRAVNLGPLTVQLTLHGAADAPEIFDAFASVRGGAVSDGAGRCKRDAPFAINVIDGTRCSVARPRLKWRASDFGPKRIVPGWSDKERTTYFLRGESGLAVADWRSNRAYVWVPSIEAIVRHDQAAPFRWIIDGLAQRRGLTAMHASVIGEHGIGLLIVGEGGRGKSTLALAGIAAGMEYLADDYCLVCAQPPYPAYRLFNTAKVRVESKVVTSGMVDLEHAIEPGHGGKRIFNLARYAPQALVERLEIRALLLPEFTDNALPTIDRVSSGEAFRRAAPSTVAQCAGSEAQAAADVGRLARALPAYRIRMPPEPALSIDPIRQLIRALREGASW
jgi:hypothetical protein